MKVLLKKLFRTFGYDISRYHHAYHPNARRSKLFKVHNIDTILDVGANAGQYGEHLRNDGYSERLISFEPLSDAYSELEQKAAHDIKWTAVNIALGDRDGDAVINVSKNSWSSSFLDMLPAHENSAPDSVYVSKEKTKVFKLDSMFEKYCSPASNIYMKVDTQGFGMEVLKGAKESLAKIRGIEIEVSLVSLYENEALIEDFIVFLRGEGFVPMGIEPGFSDQETGQLLQADFIFYRA